MNKIHKNKINIIFLTCFFHSSFFIFYIYLLIWTLQLLRQFSYRLLIKSNNVLCYSFLKFCTINHLVAFLFLAFICFSYISHKATECTEMFFFVGWWSNEFFGLKRVMWLWISSCSILRLFLLASSADVTNLYVVWYVNRRGKK